MDGTMLLSNGSFFSSNCTTGFFLSEESFIWVHKFSICLKTSLFLAIRYIFYAFRKPVCWRQIFHPDFKI